MVEFSLSRAIKNALPATAGEVAAMLGTSHKMVLALLYQMRDRGVVFKTDRRVDIGKRGPKPALWDRA